jgi:hypothetical protein
MTQKQSAVQVLGEQTGAPETSLKQALSAQFVTLPVKLAYLARIAYENNPQWGVMLALRLKEKGAEQRVVDAVNEVFASMADSNSSLEISFLDDAMQEYVESRCPAFYNNSR